MNMAHHSNTNGVSAIVPAYNEASRIGCVLSALSGSELTDEIVAIDDGSTDETHQIAGSFPKVKVIRNERNLGKHEALMKGVRESTRDVLLFLDADIEGLTPVGVDKLIRPVLNGECDLTIAYRSGTSFWDRFIVWSEPCLCGERCIQREAFLAIKGIEDIGGYEIEACLNKHFLDNKGKIKIVPVENLMQCPKIRKHGFVKGLFGDLKMLFEIVRRIGPIEMLRQVIRISVAFQLGRLLARISTSADRNATIG
jgi:glycosyltransferase involved in cell wall biosynthesis